MLGLLRRLANRTLGFFRRRPPAPPAGVGANAAVPRRGWGLPAWVAALRTRVFLHATVAGALAFGMVAWLVGAGQTASADLALAQGLQQVQEPWFASRMVGVSDLGFPPLSLLLVLGVAGALWLLGRPLEASLAVVGSGAALLAQPFKLLLARPRPTADAVRVASALPDSSFPSGHTLLYVGFYGFLFYLAYTRLRRSRVRTLLLWTLGGLIVLVGPSRVYLGHHWPSDVLASYALGLVYLAVLDRKSTR